MKKVIKKYKCDLLSIVLLTLIFLGLFLFLTNGTYLYGSVLDWSAQHAVIPDYFRTLFYDTKDLLPDFAANVGNGQNIYNLSYYGFLSPVILLSYFMPKVEMVDYIVVSTIVIVLVSTYLLYLFLRSKEYKCSVCFVACLAFMLSSAVSLHSHRHIMFINYMPFLILALFGVDKKFSKGRSWLLSLAVFLMIMTSYYFSIGGIVCVFIYAFIEYLKRMNTVTTKTFLKTFFQILGPVLVSIFASAIITVPTLATILYNRADSNIIISWKDLFIPSINTDNLLYGSYGIGLTAIVVCGIVNLFMKKKKESIGLGIILTLLVIFNVFNWGLNGTMYIDSKSLIPFLPIYILVIAEFISDMFDKKINLKIFIPIILIISVLVYFYEYKWDVYIVDILVLLVTILLYYKFKKKGLFIVPVSLFIIITSFTINKTDALTLRYTYEDNTKHLKDYVDFITEHDRDVYRISSDVSRTEFPNAIFGNIDYYFSTIYSSVSNQVYNKFYYDMLMNNIPSRNRSLTVSNQNLLSLMLMGNKYMINSNENLVGYRKVRSSEGINVYENDNVLPLGFATSEVMSYKDFYELSDYEKQEALLKAIVADSESMNSFVSSGFLVNWDFSKILENDNVSVEKDGSLSVYAKDTLKISYELPDMYKNKILLIRFKMNKSSYNNDLIVTINGVKNKLTASSWKYYNGNVVFDYVLACEKQEKLVFNFAKGDYNLSDFEVFVLDYADIENVSKVVDKFLIDKEATKGDRIVGEVNVSRDGYFMLTMPYDRGFTIYVDGIKTTYEKVDDGFIGFPIKNGVHNIEIEYVAPLKEVALKMSSIGFLAFVLITILEARKKI